LPLLSILIFCGGDLEKGMGGKGEGRRFLFKIPRKGSGRDSNTVMSKRLKYTK